jgi:abortive infection bacteriophage resistance protein
MRGIHFGSQITHLEESTKTNHPLNRTLVNTIRNICAHHSRLWNRELGNRPMIPRLEEFPDWHLPVQIRNERLFGILTILKHSMNRIAPQSQWALRFHQFLADYPDIPIADMGFPENWDQSPIWK